MRAVLLIAGYLAALGVVWRAQEPPVPVPIDLTKLGQGDAPKGPVNLDDPLDGKDTVARLASRLRLMTGDYDNLLNQLKDVQKKNAGKKMSQDDLLKQFSGNNQSLLKSILDKMNGDPSFDPSKLFGKGGGPSPDAFKGMLDGLKTGSVTMPDFKPGSLDLGKLDGKAMGGITLPENAPKWLQDAVSGWEKNVGPLGNNPELQKTLEGLLSKENGFDPSKWKDWLGGKGFDTSQLDGLFGKNVPKLDLSKAPDINLKLNPGQTKLPSFNFGTTGGPGWTAPSAPNVGGWSFPTLGGFGGGGLASLTPLAVLLGIVVVALLVWWFWPQIKESMAKRAGPEPLTLPDGFDPRLVTDRPTLVKAFELLSVVLCGPDAKMWNHVTIGGALKQFLADNPAGAEQLAVLYALARYTPPNEPLTPEAIAQARQALCTLAGVSAA
jgi:hypothetical protein